MLRCCYSYPSTDVEGSTALTQRLGDAKARALLREHEGIVREALKANAGRCPSGDAYAETESC